MRRAPSPVSGSRAGGSGAMSVGKAVATKAPSRPVGSATGGSGRATPPALPAARKTGSASSSPAGTPSTSDRNLGVTGTQLLQKPKPSALAAQRLSAGHGSGSPQALPLSGDAKRRPSGSGRARPSSEAPPQLAIEVASGADEDEPFVPEEEEEGPSTQGDHLMMAKSKMRRQRSGNSPGLHSPNSPVRATAAPPCRAASRRVVPDRFVPRRRSLACPGLTNGPPDLATALTPTPPLPSPLWPCGGAHSAAACVRACPVW
jgi:hypothetical protein